MTKSAFKQKDEIKYEAFTDENRVSLREALKSFSLWFKTGEKNNRTLIWGNGSDFDITILGEAYNRCNIEIPWKYWLVRDLRTLLDIGNIKMIDRPQYNLHHALYDCYRQIIGLTKALININK